MKHDPDMTDLTRRQAIASRDARFDGAFVYGVTTTGIYCRPSCPSKRAKDANIRCFAMPEAARLAGFRACKRCNPDIAKSDDPALASVRRAAAAIERHVADDNEGPPRLADIARAAKSSPHHLQRRFTELVGLSPRAYADALRLRKLRKNLRSGTNVSDAIYGAGFGSGSRVYGRAARDLGMTPASYAKGGRGAEMYYAIADSRLGRLLVAATAKGIAFVALGDDDAKLVDELRTDFPQAKIKASSKALQSMLSQVLAHIDAVPPHDGLPLDIRGTAFQWRVWQALAQIPVGETRTYGEIAEAIGAPKAARAVGRACGTNPVALVIPCHRAIGGSGSLTGYRWGLGRKKHLLELEQKKAR